MKKKIYQQNRFRGKQLAITFKTLAINVSGKSGRLRFSQKSGHHIIMRTHTAHRVRIGNVHNTYNG